MIAKFNTYPGVWLAFWHITSLSLIYVHL